MPAVLAPELCRRRREPELPMPATQIPEKVRVTIQQPSLTAYRVPVFEALSQRQGIDLQVIYSQIPGGPPNVSPGAFKAQCVDMKQWTVAGQPFLWHRPQISYATTARTDVLILSWNTRYLSLIPSLLRSRRHGVRTVLWGHGFSKKDAPWRRGPRNTIARLADALLFYNHSVAKRFLEEGWDPERIYVAPNALDQRPIQEARQHWLDQPQKLQQFRQQQQLGEGPVLLHVSRIAPARRLDMLLEAAQKLIPRFPNLQIVIIGQGDHQAALTQLARQMCIEQHVRFLGAIYGQQDLAPWFLNSDVFAFPAHMGLSLLHAFGYGLPVVTTDRARSHGPEFDALKPGINGNTYRDGDTDSLAATLDDLLSNPERRAQMGREALRTALEEYSIEKMVDGMEAAVRYCAKR